MKLFPDNRILRSDLNLSFHFLWITYILVSIYARCFVKGKIEKVPRGIRGEKSSKDMASSRNLVSTIGALASPKWGTEPGVRKGQRSLLASHTSKMNLFTIWANVCLQKLFDVKF